MKPQAVLRSGALAKQAGVSTDTLRLYERKGLLQSPLRDANGYRCYPADSLARVCLIRAALSIGFTLDELAAILRERDAGGSPCRKVRELANSKVQALDQHIRHLAQLRDHLCKVLDDWDQLLVRTPPRKRAGLLEALAATPQSIRSLPPHIYAAIKETQS